MRVALISDLHANALALGAVIDDIARAGVDQLVCLGDVATLGPEPREVIQMLRDLGCPCILGNHDEFLLDPPLIHTYTEARVVVQAVDWCRDALAASDLDFLRSFRSGMEIDLGGNSNLLLFHGSPRSHMEDILSTTAPDALDQMLGGRTATVMAGGHTHFQMLRQHRGMLLVNPGSVGIPFKDFVPGQAPTLMSHAEYAIVEATAGSVGVQLRRVHLDRRELRARAAAALDHPMRADWLEQYA